MESSVTYRDDPRTPDPRDFQPLPAHDFHVLLALAEGPRHANGLAQAGEDLRDGMVRLELGSLYRVLALPLVRMGLGRMMGVDHNEVVAWVGASAALIENHRERSNRGGGS
jgi:hypothetical protein